jgi:Protein of unknown function (DUF3352)
MKARQVLPVAAATAALALAVAGCGSGDGGSSFDPAALAPPKSPLFIEAALQPEGEVKTNIERLFERISGIDTDLGELIISELESSASSSGEELDFDKEVKPWLGETGGLFFLEYDGDDFSGYGVAVQTTDAGASQNFIEKQGESDGEAAEDGSYDGVDYRIDGDDGATAGVVGDFVAIAEDERTFKLMVDASGGESLAGADLYSETVAAAPEDSFADVFVDIGGLIEQAGGSIDPEAKQFLDSAGIEPEEATAVASLLPGSEQIEIDFSSDLGGQSPPSGAASSLLGSLPAKSVAAFAAADFGDRFEEALDQIDTNGIPGEVPPGKFKSTLKEAGIEVDRIAGSIGDLGVFAEGSSESSLAGAAVLTTKDAREAKNAVSNVGLLLRASGTPGVTVIPAIPDGAFSVRSPDLGRRLVIAARDRRIVIAYGVPAAFRGLGGNSDQSLADNPVYKEAVSALGGTPISGFADGPAALKLATALIPTDDEEGFREAKPYLAKIEYLAIGTGSSGDLATAKLIAGIGDR